MDDKYYKIKHLVDFYLEENEIIDLLNYRLCRPTNKVVNIEHWGYTNIAKPSYEDLKKLVTKPNFIQHRNKNMIISKLEFTLKIKFTPGEYKRGEVINNKYEKYPYIWFINPQCTSLLTGADFIRFHVTDSVLYINNDFTVPPVNKTYHLSCVLIPKKDLNIPGDNKYTVNMKPVKPSQPPGLQEEKDKTEALLIPKNNEAGDAAIKKEVIVPTYKKR